MALYVFRCTAGHVFKKLGDTEPAAPVCKCGQVGTRRPQGNSASVYETLDNGIQSKATVRPADAQRIFKEIEIASDLNQPQAPDEADLERLDDIGDLL